jgi:hypothetical protein
MPYYGVIELRREYALVMRCNVHTQLLYLLLNLGALDLQ